MANTLVHLEDIYTQCRKNGVFLSKSQSTKIVGSRRYLEQLIESGKIRVKKESTRQMALCKCNAEDVLRYANYKERKDWMN